MAVWGAHKRPGHIVGAYPCGTCSNQLATVAGPAALAFGVSRSANKVKSRWQWHELIIGDVGCPDMGSARRTNEASLPSSLHDQGDRVEPTIGPARHVGHKQGQRDIEGIDASSSDDLHLQGVHHLSDDKHRPDVQEDDFCLHDHRRCRFRSSLISLAAISKSQRRAYRAAMSLECVEADIRFRHDCAIMGPTFRAPVHRARSHRSNHPGHPAHLLRRAT